MAFLVFIVTNYIRDIDAEFRAPLRGPATRQIDELPKVMGKYHYNTQWSMDIATLHAIARKLEHGPRNSSVVTLWRQMKAWIETESPAHWKYTYHWYKVNAYTS